MTSTYEVNEEELKLFRAYQEAISKLSEKQFEKLWHHRGKGHWAGIPPLEAFKRLMEEATELLEAVLNGYSVDDVRKEAADVANFAMIMAEAYETKKIGEKNDI